MHTQQVEEEELEVLEEMQVAEQLEVLVLELQQVLMKHLLQEQVEAEVVIIYQDQAQQVQEDPEVVGREVFHLLQE